MSRPHPLKDSLFLILLIVMMFLQAGVPASLWSDEGTPQNGEVLNQALSLLDLKSGIKEELLTAVRLAVDHLGEKDGYLKDPELKIPLPDSLKLVEKGLKRFGQGQIADQFVESMNRAAEKAAPETLSVFVEAVKGLSLEEAQKIISGPNDAATQFFKGKAANELVTRLKPIVKDATDEANVTHYFKLMMEKAKTFVPFLGAVDPDLENYVTQRAVDGLFLAMAREEKNIRENPQARTTELLQKVFGAPKK